MVKPPKRKEMAQQFVASMCVAIKRACAGVGISETCYRYQALQSCENQLIADWLIRLTEDEKD